MALKLILIVTHVGTLFYINGGFPSRDIYLMFREAQDVGNYTIMSAKDYSPVAAGVYNETIENEAEFFGVIFEKRAFIKSTTLEVWEKSNVVRLMRTFFCDIKVEFSRFSFLKFVKCPYQTFCKFILIDY